MPTTTNYGWTTPADTDLVKDGASAIRTLGSAIDTTVFNNANAAIAKSIVDAKGDLIAATAADTVARLASSGVNGEVLTVDTTTSTGLKWAGISAGGLTLLSTTSLSGASTTISGISGSYKNLYIEIEGVTNATANGIFRIYPNNVNNLTNFAGISNTSGGSSTYGRVNDYIRLTDNAGQLLRTSSVNNFSLIIYDYANASYFKNGTAYGNYVQASDSTTVSEATFWAFKSTSAITSLVFSNSAGNLSTGTVRIYGEK